MQLTQKPHKRKRRRIESGEDIGTLAPKKRE